MVDVMKPEQRYLAMAHNRGRTKPEKSLASALWKNGVRYFTGAGYKSVTGIALTGHPDMILPRKRIVIFVDGCFWHGCSRCKGIPKQSGEFWKKKIKGNIKRDIKVAAQLKDDGWRVIRVWEHDLTKATKNTTVNRVMKKLIHASYRRHSDSDSAVRKVM